LKEEKSPFEGGVWDFWEHGVSQSFIQLFRSCKEQTRLAFVEGWTSRKSSLALDFGTCCHVALSELHGKKKVPTVNQIDRAIDVFEKDWKREYPKPTTKQTEEIHHVMALAKPVLEAYVKRYAGDWGGKYPFRNKTVVPATWLHLESRFRVPFEFEDGKIVWLNGRFDGGFEDNRKIARKWLFETKTKAMIQEDIIVDLLPLDVQVMLYLWALWKTEGVRPTGVLYNVIRRPGLRQGKAEQFVDFIKRVREDVFKPARQDHYFIRWELQITKKELEVWERTQLRPMLEEIRLWWEGKSPHYLNESALVAKYGRCSLYEPIVNGNFNDCFQREHPFNELVDFGG